MRCRYCGAGEARVIESRVIEEGDAVRRRRECGACRRRFTTLERAMPTRLMVRKRDGNREEFDRVKVVRGMLAALKNRPIPAAVVEEIAAELEEALDGAVEVTSTEIGLAVLEHLRALDEVGYLRFASVYQNFDGVEDFRRAVLEIDSSLKLTKRAGEATR